MCSVWWRIRELRNLQHEGRTDSGIKNISGEVDMRNLNPVTGYKQAMTGHFYISRICVLDLIRKHGLSPSEIGYYFMFVNCADWDRDSYRYSFIRLDYVELSKILNTPERTIRGNLKKLAVKGLIDESNKAPQIVDFERFTYSEAIGRSKEKFTDTEVANYFGLEYFPNIPKMVVKSNEGDKKMSFPEPNKGSSFNCSNKDKNKDWNRGGRTREEYEEIYMEHPDTMPKVEDMILIDELLTVEQAEKVFLGKDDEGVNKL